MPKKTLTSQTTAATKISLWLGDGCLASSAATFTDAFSIANLWYAAMQPEAAAPLFETEIVSTDGCPVTAYGNIRIQADGAVCDIGKTECIIISPLLPNVTPIPSNLDILCRCLRDLKDQGTASATVCTGTFLLAEMGFLDGKQATTNWTYARLFKKRYPRVNLEPAFMVTEDDNIICAGAATAVYHLAIHLIKKFGSQRLATVCAKALLVDPNRVSQAPYAISAPLFKKATGELPLKYLQRVRIDAAKERLETTRESIDKITWAVGYKDVSSFCRLFKQHTQISPRAYRDKFFSQMPW